MDDADGWCGWMMWMADERVLAEGLVVAEEAFAGLAPELALLDEV